MTQDVTIPEITAKEQLQPDLERAVEASGRGPKASKKGRRERSRMCHFP